MILNKYSETLKNTPCHFYDTHYTQYSAPINISSDIARSRVNFSISILPLHALNILLYIMCSIIFILSYHRALYTISVCVPTNQTNIVGVSLIIIFLF